MGWACPSRIACADSSEPWPTSFSSTSGCLLRKASAAASIQSRFSVPKTKVTVTFEPGDDPAPPGDGVVPGSTSAPRFWASQTTPPMATSRRTTISSLPRMESS